MYYDRGRYIMGVTLLYYIVTCEKVIYFFVDDGSCSIFLNLFAVSQESLYININNLGPEPTTPTLRVSCSTD